MKKVLGLALLCGVSATSGTAHAQETYRDYIRPFLDTEIPFDISRGRNISVMERDRPEYAPLGIRFGTFLVRPSLQTGLGYSDNVFGAKTGKVDDAFAVFDPKLTVQSDWSRHAASLTAQAQLRRFFDETIKDEDGLYFNADGRLDIGNQSNIVGAATFRRSYEAQYSGSFPANASRSVRYDRTGGLVRASLNGVRVRGVISADVNHLDFRDVTTTSGLRLDQDFRDRTISRGSARLEYSATPDVAGFVQTTLEMSDYDNRDLPGGNRDSDEWRVIGGVTFDLSALMRASIGAGYVRRDYKSATLETISGLAADARLEYFPSQITTVTLTAQRTIEDSVVPGSSGFFVTELGARIDHELLRNLLLNAELTHQRDKFQTIDRRDSFFSIGGGGHYLVSRNFYLNADISYIDRNSSGTVQGQEFKEFRFIFSITTQL